MGGWSMVRLAVSRSSKAKVITNFAAGVFSGKLNLLAFPYKTILADERNRYWQV